MEGLDAEQDILIALSFLPTGCLSQGKISTHTLENLDSTLTSYSKLMSSVRTDLTLYAFGCDTLRGIYHLSTEQA